MQSRMRRPAGPDQRMGAQTALGRKTNIDVAAETGKKPQLVTQLGNVNNVFTDQLIEEVNAFDRAAVIKQAKAFQCRVGMRLVCASFAGSGFRSEAMTAHGDQRTRPEEFAIPLCVRFVRVVLAGRC
jgi:hypothetical protein